MTQGLIAFSYRSVFYYQKNLTKLLLSFYINNRGYYTFFNAAMFLHNALLFTNIALLVAANAFFEQCCNRMAVNCVQFNIS